MPWRQALPDRAEPCVLEPGSAQGSSIPGHCFPSHRNSSSKPAQLVPAPNTKTGAIFISAPGLKHAATLPQQTAQRVGFAQQDGGLLSRAVQRGLPLLCPRNKQNELAVRVRSEAPLHAICRRQARSLRAQADRSRSADSHRQPQQPHQPQLSCRRPENRPVDGPPRVHKFVMWLKASERPSASRRGTKSPVESTRSCHRWSSWSLHGVICSHPAAL
jgi:hypothetical protein